MHRLAAQDLGQGLVDDTVPYPLGYVSGGRNQHSWSAAPTSSRARCVFQQHPYEDSNLDLNVRSVALCPLNYRGRTADPGVEPGPPQ